VRGGGQTSCYSDGVVVGAAFSSYLFPLSHSRCPPFMFPYFASPSRV